MRDVAIYPFPIPEMLPDEFGMTADHHQQIVEVVCYPTGEPPDGLHLLSIAKLLFEFAIFGDIIRQNEACLHRAKSYWL